MTAVLIQCVSICIYIVAYMHEPTAGWGWVKIEPTSGPVHNWLVGQMLLLLLSLPLGVVGVFRETRRSCSIVALSLIGPLILVMAGLQGIS